MINDDDETVVGRVGYHYKKKANVVNLVVEQVCIYVVSMHIQ